MGCVCVCVCVYVCMRMWEGLWKLKGSWRSRAKNVEKHVKKLHQKRKSCENSTIFGTVGAKNVECGKFCIRRRKSCEKPKDFLWAVGPKMRKNLWNLAWEEGTSCENPTSFGTVGPKMWQKCRKFCIRKGQFLWRIEDSWCNAGPKLWKNVREKRPRKHIAFWTTHEITYLNSGEFNLPQVKNYIADIYFSEPNFEYVKNSLT